MCLQMPMPTLVGGRSLRRGRREGAVRIGRPGTLEERERERKRGRGETTRRASVTAGTDETLRQTRSPEKSR